MNNNQQVSEYVRNIKEKLENVNGKLITARDILRNSISINGCAYKYNEINDLYSRVKTQIRNFNNIK